MQVVILCGGMGTRLKEETEFRPKPMVNIGNRPILWHIMKLYAHYGFNEFILALGYKGEMIKNYFVNYEVMNNDVKLTLGKPGITYIGENHSETGWAVTLADTGESALKGARIKRIERYIRGDIFMLTYGDGLADIDITSLIRFHRSHSKLATVTGINPASRFGELKIDGDTVKAFYEKPEDSPQVVNGGFFVLNRCIFDYLRDQDDCDFEIGPMERIARDGQLKVYKHGGFWASMDTLRDMEYLNNLWNNNVAPWKVW